MSPLGTSTPVGLLYPISRPNFICNAEIQAGYQVDRTNKHGIGISITSGCQSHATAWCDPWNQVPLCAHLTPQVGQNFIYNADIWVEYQVGHTNKHRIGFSITS